MRLYSIMKHILIACLLSLISAPSFACSCAPWTGGLVSEFVGNYTSFWGVPVRSDVKTRSTDRPELIVGYEVELVEGYDRVVNEKLEVISSIVDGGSCGIELSMGTPQFLSAYKINNRQFGINSCTPHIPYKSILNYLENGVDAIVPADYDCLNEENKIKLENPDCAIWEGAITEYWQRKGAEDYIGYLVSWRESKTKNLTPR